MSVTLQMELVTPEKLVIARQVESVVVPGLDGDFGVLAGHIPFVSVVRPGKLVITDGPDQVSYYAVSSGYAEALPDRVTVLVDQAIAKADIQASSVRLAAQEAEKQLAVLNEEDPNYARLKDRVAYAQVQLDMSAS
ncbi:MAG: ATP synthase F1 subunit epsilon [Magnetococcus sp. DMHC-6]